MVPVSPSVVLEHDVLPFVRKPQRYTGLELNRIVKTSPEVRWALAFPDLYEIAMSYLGLQILYHYVNTSVPEVAVERVFLPEEDAAVRFRMTGLPLTTLESRTPLRDVDLLGVSLSYEMAMPGLLELLDLGGVPLRSSSRDEGDPIVIAGGPVAFNPEPVADFLDLVVLGDGEEVAVEIARIALRAKRERWARARLLDRLAQLDGVYRPGRHPVTELPDGRLVVVREAGAKPLITGRTVESLRPAYYPDRPLVPTLEVTFDRLSLEVMRGCTRGCRFCQAGTLYRPVRERPVEDLVAQARNNIAATGYNEISLTSLSTSDYSPLAELIGALSEEFQGKGISLAFPSLRPDSFTPEMARAFPDGRKGGITFAPEAGTQRLRDIINKNSREEDLLRAAGLAFEEGYNSIKLYFMIGLPGETMADLDGIADLALKVVKRRKRGGQKVSVSVSPFAPKAHTPFQRVAQDTPEILREKLGYLRQKFRGIPVRFVGHDPDSALYESALARGDRRLAGVIERVWRNGGWLEAWNDRFDPERWAQAYRDENLDPRGYVKAIPTGSPLSWGHLSKGVTERFFEKEMKRALEAVTAPDCREGKCDTCGLAKFIPKGAKVCNIYPAAQAKPPEAGPKVPRPVEVAVTARVLYRCSEPMRWTGHLDMVRLWDRLMRRGKIPVAFSQGFHPHPRVSFAPPLPVGLVSEDEYIDIDLTEPLEASDVLERLRAHAPGGVEPLEVVMLKDHPPALTSLVEFVEYGFKPVAPDEFNDQLARFFAQETIEVERVKGDKVRRINIRPFVERVTAEADGNWRVRLRVENGSTARLNELGQAWGLGDSLGTSSARMAMLVRDGESLKRPIEAVANELSRAKGVRA